MLYLHGGGYLVGSPASHRALLAHLGRAAGAPVHAIDYRLAPAHPFPAALDDAVAAYRALLAAGHPSQRIAVAGDSAGGGLRMSLLLRLRALEVDLPGSVGLISPWLDLDLRSPLLWANANTDALLDPSWLAGAADDYRAGSDAPELRPLEADLAGLPPLHVIAGADEVLVGDSDVLVERAKEAGAPVTYRREPCMWHVYPIFAGLGRGGRGRGRTRRLPGPGLLGPTDEMNVVVVRSSFDYHQVHLVRVDHRALPANSRSPAPSRAVRSRVRSSASARSCSARSISAIAGTRPAAVRRAARAGGSDARP